MKPPSEKRKRTLALHDRALRFSVGVNSCCPERPPKITSQTVWEQLVGAADSVSHNLVEADAASSDADFVNKMQLTLREAKEAKEAKVCLAKVRLGLLAGFEKTKALGLEEEAAELSAIFATIVMNVSRRLEGERKHRTTRKRQTSNLKL